uniref:Uncharacterized protein n=1 Tax=Strigamia maritima TaxID=126957 RepID=T1J5U1_STRMM
MFVFGKKIGFIFFFGFDFFFVLICHFCSRFCFFIIFFYYISYLSTQLRFCLMLFHDVVLLNDV